MSILYTIIHAEMHKTSRCPWPWTKVYLLEHGLVTSCSGLAFWPAWGALPWWPLQHGMHLVHRLDSSTVRHARWVPTCQSLTAAAVGMVSADFWDGGKYCLGGGGSIRNLRQVFVLVIGHSRKIRTMHAWFWHVQMHFREKEQTSGGALGEGFVTSWRNFGRFHFAFLCSCPLHLIVRNRYRCKLL